MTVGVGRQQLLLLKRSGLKVCQRRPTQAPQLLIPGHKPPLLLVLLFTWAPRRCMWCVDNDHATLKPKEQVQ
jgi:hypothetical protein